MLSVRSFTRNRGSTTGVDSPAVCFPKRGRRNSETDGRHAKGESNNHEMARWQLKGDQDAGRAFVGSECTLCKDPDWFVKKKNMK